MDFKKFALELLTATPTNRSPDCPVPFEEVSRQSQPEKEVPRLNLFSKRNEEKPPSLLGSGDAVTVPEPKFEYRHLQSQDFSSLFNFKNFKKDADPKPAPKAPAEKKPEVSVTAKLKNYLEGFEEKNKEEVKIIRPNYNDYESNLKEDDQDEIEELLAKQKGMEQKQDQNFSGFSNNFGPPGFSNGPFGQPFQSSSSFNPPGGMFFKAGGGQIQLTEEQMRQARNMLKDSDEEDLPEDEFPPANPFSNPFSSSGDPGFGNPSVGFSNPFASGQEFQQGNFSNFSNNQFQNDIPKANVKMFNREGDQNKTNFENIPAFGSSSEAFGFFKPNGAKVEINQKLMQDAMNLLKDDDDDEILPAPKIQDPAKSNPFGKATAAFGKFENQKPFEEDHKDSKNSETGFQGFLCAGNDKKVQFSEAELKKAMNLLKSDSEDELPVEKKPDKLPKKPEPKNLKQNPGKISEDKSTDPSNRDENENTVPEQIVKREVINAANTVAFSKDIAAKKKPVPKKQFAFPFSKNVGAKLTKPLEIKKEEKKLKLRESKLSVLGGIDQNRYLIMCKKVNSKKKKLQVCNLATSSKNYGHSFLEMEDIFEYLKEELGKMSITSAPEMLEEILVEMKHQVNNSELELDWVKHQLKMLSRKYYRKIRSVLVPSMLFHEKVMTLEDQIDTKYILTDIYYRYKREEYFTSISGLRQIIEGKVQADKRLCLMVTNIVKGTDKYTMELTDGWYLVTVELYTSEEKEKMMVGKDLDTFFEFNNNLLLRLILINRIRLGEKLEISNMSLKKGENHQPYHKNLAEVSFNSIKLLPRNAKMGLLFNRLKPTKIGSVKISGGMIPLIDVLVLEKRGLKFKDKDEYLIAPQQTGDGESRQESIDFTVVFIDTLHLDPEYNQAITHHHLVFRGVDFQVFNQIEVGQRLRIYNAKLRKGLIGNVKSANFEMSYTRGMMFECRRNNVDTWGIPQASKGERYNELIEVRRKNFVPIETLKDELVKIANSKTDYIFVITAALKYIKHQQNVALFHFHEKHFIQLELLVEEQKGRPAKKDSLFWDRVSKEVGAITEANPELVVFYDLPYTKATKIIELKSRGKIYIHKFTFTMGKEFMLGESFATHSFPRNSLEMFMVGEYKRTKNVKFEDPKDSMQQLLGVDLSQMNKVLEVNAEDLDCGAGPASPASS
jgi:hypothetical protein